MPLTKVSKKDHFDSKWVPEPFSGCWIWQHSTAGNGYGAFHYHRRFNYAHREAWRIYRGEIPTNLFVLHRCDTPACVNPDHLFLGTQTDNQRDCLAKGRKPQGSAHCWARLSERDIVEIRNSPLPSTKLSKIFLVNPSQIRKIRRRERWRQVA